MSRIAIIIFLSLFSNLNSASVRKKKRETVAIKDTPKWNYQPSNYSDKLVDVLLRDPSQLHPGTAEYIPTKSNQRGLIELFLPGAPESLFLCFPQNSEDYRRAYILSHIICRQMGFMTFISMNSKLSASIEDKLFYGLKPNSFSCTGQEQNVSHCEWNSVNVGSCKAITDLSCGDCQYAIKETSGFIEVPGYPLVNLHDITCEWDLMLDEDHTIELSFHHFHSLFAKSSKLYCNLREPHMDIMYGSWNKLNYRRYCNLDDVKNLTVPHERVKIRIFTGVYAPFGLKNEATGKGVAITYEAKPIEQPGNWTWKVVFVALFLLIFLVTSALFHYCKKYGFCDVGRSNDTLPTVNVPPTLADIDRAYEFQRCAIQGFEARNHSYKCALQENEKGGLRMRSIGSRSEISNILFPSFNADETFVVSKSEKKDLIQKENAKHHIYVETPRTIIPEIVLSGNCDDDDEIHPIERVKVNLLDRYSKNSCDLSGISSRISSSSPVFFPQRQSFQIYNSVSSETEVKDPPPPYENAK
ncbi:uncharacterized protein [Parasteatoda tepidariorum]|uniref:uncharacterized protein n=1 Tax=Parasteatoda tepidariorum TaxID=114398 RepID=UPI001C7280E7|nr:uncharacterized protein LOC107453306 [Parasteatoda tepidariorum]